MRPAVFVALALLAAPAGAGEFRWATTADPSTLDPHARNTASVLGFLNNVYEGLVRRGRDMGVEPALATSWAPLEGEHGWRFTLRDGVLFHNDAAFDASDVKFSFERATAPTSDVASWFAQVTEVRVVDPLTVDFVTAAPNPIFPDSIANFMIMDAGWAEANDAAAPNREEGNFATLNANGTGAFRIVSREPGIQTVLEPHAKWWDEAEHDVERAIHRPIQSPATAVAALISGGVEFIEPAPVQDVERLRQNPETQILDGMEARVIFLGFRHAQETLMDGGANLFADRRLRQAVAHAINTEALIQVVMRGSAQPASQLIDPTGRGWSAANAERPAYDPEAAKALIAEAGAEGLAFTLACPNNRYVNDEAICQAAVAMLAQVGLRPRLTTLPAAQYFPSLREGAFDMYMLGWSAGTFDHEHPLRFLASTPNPEKRLGSWNFGGYSNATIDALLPRIQSELDDAARQAMIDEAVAAYQGDVAYVPLHVQPLLWGVRADVQVTQRADNFFLLRWARMGD